MKASPQTLPRMRNISEKKKGYRENHGTYFMCNKFSSEDRAIYQVT
jgi:hypothetical protein